MDHEVARLNKGKQRTMLTNYNYFDTYFNI